MDVFFAYRDVPERRRALAAPLDAPDRYRLFGLDAGAAHGARVHHNLEQTVPSWARLADRAVNRVLYAGGGYGGDFATICSSLRQLTRCEVIFSTVDTVGLPLVLLKRAGLVRPPIVYTSIGLPERLEQLRGERMQRLYRNALRGCSMLIAYGAEEVERLRVWLGPDAPSVRFVPFGVDTEAFHPLSVEPRIDVLSVGADPRRDFRLLLDVAVRHADWRVHIVASSEHARALRGLPENVELETDLPLDAVRERFASSRVVALPVRDNTYSGATTTLLQAMAMAKPVVVSATAAIASGYELEDGTNCRLVRSGDPAALDEALGGLLADRERAASIGESARETVRRSLSWERYTSTLWEIIAEANAESTSASAKESR